MNQNSTKMILVRLSGHSCAGKSRLTAASRGFTRCVIYTSRQARKGELDGVDYYFLSRSAIEALPDEHFFKGQVREMIQAVDLQQLASDLANPEIRVVLIELYDRLWPGLETKLRIRIGPSLVTKSVFLTAVDRNEVETRLDEAGANPNATEEVREWIYKQVYEWVKARGKDQEDKWDGRAKDAVTEVIAAVTGESPYDRIFHSAPEGPDGQDEWTRSGGPTGQARICLDEFMDWLDTL